MRYYFMRFPKGKTKAVTLSYDDGCRSDLRLAETINKYGLKCTFNLNSERIGCDDWHLTKEEIAEKIIGTGHEIANHGAWHKAPGMTTVTDGIRDAFDGRRGLENMFGRIIKGMAYPNSGILTFDNGSDYGEVKNYLKQLGIVYARTLGADNDRFRLPEDWHKWVPTAHHDNPKIMEYIDKFLNTDVNSLYEGSRWPLLFYMWGHTFEFDRNNNWERLNEICEKLSGNDDIWYATNIEIYNYTAAYRSLEFNIDRTLAYNPTVYNLWFNADGKDYCIKSGETVEL